jgi:hypothetical protein
MRFGGKAEAAEADAWTLVAIDFVSALPNRTACIPSFVQARFRDCHHRRAVSEVLGLVLSDRTCGPGVSARATSQKERMKLLAAKSQGASR